jgi:hypothetical protein
MRLWHGRRARALRLESLVNAWACFVLFCVAVKVRITDEQAFFFFDFFFVLQLFYFGIRMK